MVVSKMFQLLMWKQAIKSGQIWLLHMPYMDKSIVQTDNFGMNLNTKFTASTIQCYFTVMKFSDQLSEVCVCVPKSKQSQLKKHRTDQLTPGVFTETEVSYYAL